MSEGTAPTITGAGSGAAAAAGDELALRARLAKLEAKNQKLKSTLKLVNERLQNTGIAVRSLTETRAELKAAQADLQAERELGAMLADALEEQARETKAAKAAAQAAQSTAEAAAEDAARVQRELAGVQAQLRSLQAQCEGFQRQLAAGGAAPSTQQQQQQQLDGPVPAAVQQQLAAMQEEMQRVRAALAPLAALATGIAGLEGGAAPLAPPARAAAQPAAAAAGQAAAAADTSPRKQRRQARTAAQKPAAAAGKEAAAADQAAAEHARVLAVAPPEKPADVRARAVAAMQEKAAGGGRGATGVTAAAGARAAGGKRTAAVDAGGIAANRASALAGVLDAVQAGGRQPPSKRARLPAAAPTAALQQQQQPQQPQHQQAAAPAEASLAISANEGAVEQQREQATAADEVAQLLGRISGAGAGLDLAQVQQVAATLQTRLDRVPLRLMLACFETAVLECAAAKAQPHHLALAEPGAAASGDRPATAAAAAAPDGWFAAGAPVAADQQQQQQQQGGGDGSAGGAPGSPPFVAVWCSRDALTAHRLQWLLHCARHVQNLQLQCAAARAAAQGGGLKAQPAGLLADQLRQHLHREVLRCCLAASAAGGGGHRHTETEACALAAAAAGLCRSAGDAEAFWALLLDLAACPGAAAGAVLPPLAAALDVWPLLVQPGAVEGSSASLAGFHQALQHLCAQAAAAAEEPASEEAPAGAAAPDAPPPLLLERQPVAASEFLRRLGQQHWGWAPDAAGSSQALQQLQASTKEAARPGSAAGAAVASAPAAAAAAMASAVLPARAGGALRARAPATAAAPAVHALPEGLWEEEI